MPSSELQVFVRGLVQGVGFRWSARERALELGLSGWVRNLSDGRVELRLAGEPERLDGMLAWLASGPSAARVDEVSAREAPRAELEPDAGFEILR